LVQYYTLLCLKRSIVVNTSFLLIYHIRHPGSNITKSDLCKYLWAFKPVKCCLSKLFWFIIEYHYIFHAWIAINIQYMKCWYVKGVYFLVKMLGVYIYLDMYLIPGHVSPRLAGGTVLYITCFPHCNCLVINPRTKASRVSTM